MRISRQQTSAIIFSLLLILSATTVGIAFPASTPSKAVPASSSQIDSLSQREAAFSALQDATVKGKPGQKEELLTALNRTFAAYVGPNRVDDSVFAADRRIVTRTQRDAPGVAEEIADADERLARTALADAEAAHDELSADSNVTYDEASVEWELSRARTALANGGDTPVARVQRYRRAWQHAQAALDTMDRAVTPRVSITTRADPRHAESITYRLNGTVTDVRTFEIRTVTVTVADGTAKTVELKRGPAPFATGTFDTTLTLDKPVNEITVDAIDENAHLGARERGAKGNRGNGNDGAGSDEERPPSTGSDTLLLDADGLPDGYERSVVGTSPLDTDSDAPTTNVSEADDGIVDGAEDFDGDRVTTVVEYRAGTDPFDVDTDDDDLTDWFELSYERLDPLAGDTDGDGVPDGQDDTEPDGLTNAREQRYGTNPNVVDTDGDRLTDAYEVDTTLTVPTVADSDSARTGTNESGDGVSDGAEDFENDTLATALEGNISTDPFDPDTDDDRLRDAFEHAYDTIDPTTNDTDGDGALDTWEDPDDETLVNLHEQSNGTVPTDADTDDDLLTDAYEVGTTRTDPTDVDSDSTRTNRSEAHDGVRDGAEDFDGDALATRIEQNVSTDPFDVDTDDDTLTDLFEHRFATVDPLRRDTDGDGVADGREDPDDEGLVNVGEQRYGTLPLDPDTDADNLTDYYEVDTTKTNPLVPDSDSGGTVPDEAGDGVVDGSEDFDGDALANAMEFTAGTDPFDPDTDDDGLRDGFEQAYDTLSPLTNDTDGDGTLDAVEDPDGDGLVNVDEQAAGTSPVDPDTDGDTLTDAFEVERSLTSPLAVDSDSAGTNASEGDDGITDDAEDLENDSLTNAREQELGTDPLLADTDGDGLTDAYEVRTTRTDPLSNVSDSAVTNADESTNDVPDGLEDFDADQVESHYEEVFGTEPFDADTDDDGLTDGFEVRFSVLDPLSGDSDGDGVGDAREDGDGDGLDTAAEERAGTDPTATDTDFDTLNDSVELAEHGTDPRSPDTDDDGLRDDEELDLGTDPLVGDSDGDGVPDGEETFTTTATNESVGASVAITGQGNVAESVTVRNSTDAMVTSDAVASVAASKPLDFTAGREFDEATLTLSYDESKVSDESDLAVFRWKPDAQTFEEVPSTVDAANDTVSATTPHFSIYIVFDGQWYPTQFSTGDDSGGSGDSGSGGSGDDQERRIIDGGFSDLDDWTAIGDVSTDGTDAVVESDAPSDDDGGSGGDDGDDGDDGGDDGDDDGDDGDDGDDDDPDRCYTGGCIVSLSGSVATSSSSGTTSTLERDVTFEDDAVDATVSVTVEGDATADSTSDAAAVVETAGGDRELFELDSGTSGTVTREVDLSKVGGDTVTVRFTASNGATLRVSDVTVSATHDSDGDGLTNARETGGFTLGTGERIYTNPYAADTDDDGLSDGLEIDGPAENDYGTYTRLDSDPTTVDGDDDGLTDYEETYERQTYRVTTSAEDSRDLLQAESADEMVAELESRSAWTDPMRTDTDDDGLSDSREVALSTNPDDADSDGDGVTDGREVHRWETDPTLHDYRPPEVTIHQAKYGTEGLHSEYAILYSARDPSGVAEVQFIKEGDVQEALDFDGRPQNIGGRVYFEVGFLETSADAVTGTTVDVTATDAHQTETRMVALERANFYGNLAGELDHATLFTVVAAHELARVSGFTASWGSTVRGAKQGAEGTYDAYQALRENPVEYLRGITRIIEVLEEYGLLDTLVNAFAGPLQEKQATNNPYDEAENPTLYTTYKVGWYKGYVAGSVSQIVVTAGASKVVANSKYAKKIDDVLGDRSTTYRSLKGLKVRKDAAEVYVARKLVDGAGRVGSGTVRGARTVGSKVKVWRVSNDADLDTSDHSDVEQQAGGRFLARNGEEGARLLADGGDDALVVIRRFDGVDEQTAERLATLRDAGELTQSDLDLLENALDRGSIDAADLRQISKVLSESDGLRYDDDVSVAALVDIAGRDDFSDTLGVVAPNDVITKNDFTLETVRFHVGDEDMGRTHYVLRHVAGAEREEGGLTSIWPMGQPIAGRTMADIVDYDDIDRLVYETIKHGRASDNGVNVKFVYDDIDIKGISKVTVTVDEETGRVISAYPKGSAVNTYNGDANEWMDKI